MMQALFTVVITILMLPLTGIAQPTSAPSPEAKTKNAITGRVIGVDGKPVKNAAVSATNIGTRRQRPTAVTTNEDGAFRINVVNPGAYQLRASLPGYVTAKEGLGNVYAGEFATLQLVKGGVVTGKVTDASGAPIPGMQVKLIGTQATESSASKRTDDRGVYRIFGVPAGNYVVLADGIAFGWSWMNADYEENIPTYYPSATRDTALPVAIQHGEELTGIDIRYRSERGHRVSGNLTGAIAGFSSTAVSLKYPASSNDVATTYIYSDKQGVAFELRGIPNGEYDLIAERKLGMDEGAASAPHRVIVAGTDVTRVELKLMPLSSLAGRVVLEELKASERPPTCQISRNAVPEETIITARIDPARIDEAARRVPPQTTLPSAQGDFKLNNLDPGRYRVGVELPSEDWYVRAMTLPAEAATKKPLDAARSGIALRSGENVKTLTITIAKGAASVQGKLTTAQPARVHLIPVEKESADDVLRYAEVAAASDGTFTLRHLAPGKYWVLARPMALDSTERAKLRSEAAAANQVIQLQPCQRVTDYKLAMLGK
jgi:Carboxypeptidase regulatory-like domain